MSLIEIEKGDTIATKDGRERRVLSIYKPAGVVIRVDAIDDHSSSPMREPVFSKNIARVVRKGPKLGAEPEIKIPDGQKVQDKEPVSETLKDDVSGRERHQTAAAEGRAAHEKKNNKPKKGSE